MLPQYNGGEDGGDEYDDDGDEYDIGYGDGENFTLRIFCRQGSG